MLMLYRVTAILLLCLFSSACCILQECIIPLNPKLPQKPQWAINKLPPDGEGAVGCDNSYVNTYEQKDKAIRQAITELARQNGIHVISKFDMTVTDSNSTAMLETTLGTRVKLKTKIYDSWEHPAHLETCVWMKEVNK